MLLNGVGGVVDVAQRTGMMSFFGPLIAIAALIYVLLCLYLYLMQSKIIFYPNMGGRELRSSPSDIGLEYETVSLITSDQVRLHGWFVKSNINRGTVLFFHGNAGNISHRLESLRIFNHLGLSTLIIDYRGYGQSEGKISEQGIYLDARAAWKYLTENQGINPQRIIVFGRSLGGAVAANLAAKYRPAGLILESVFTSVPDMAASMYPVFPVRPLCRFQFNARQSLQGVTAPVLIVHSPDDEIIPYANGRKLFASANEPKTFLELRGGHNDGFVATGPAYYEGLNDFISAGLAVSGD